MNSQTSLRSSITALTVAVLVGCAALWFFGLKWVRGTGARNSQLSIADVNRQQTNRFGEFYPGASAVRTNTSPPLAASVTTNDRAHLANAGLQTDDKSALAAVSAATPQVLVPVTVNVHNGELLTELRETQLRLARIEAYSRRPQADERNANHTTTSEAVSYQIHRAEASAPADETSAPADVVPVKARATSVSITKPVDTSRPSASSKGLDQAKSAPAIIPNKVITGSETPPSQSSSEQSASPIEPAGTDAADIMTSAPREDIQEKTDRPNLSDSDEPNCEIGEAEFSAITPICYQVVSDGTTDETSAQEISDFESDAVTFEDDNGDEDEEIQFLPELSETEQWTVNETEALAAATAAEHPEPVAELAQTLVMTTPESALRPENVSERKSPFAFLRGCPPEDLFAERSATTVTTEQFMDVADSQTDDSQRSTVAPLNTELVSVLPVPLSPVETVTNSAADLPDTSSALSESVPFSAATETPEPSQLLIPMEPTTASADHLAQPEQDGPSPRSLVVQPSGMSMPLDQTYGQPLIPPAPESSSVSNQAVDSDVTTATSPPVPKWFKYRSRHLLRSDAPSTAVPPVPDSIIAEQPIESASPAFDDSTLPSNSSPTPFVDAADPGLTIPNTTEDVRIAEQAPSHKLNSQSMPPLPPLSSTPEPPLVPPAAADAVDTVYQAQRFSETVVDGTTPLESNGPVSRGVTFHARPPVTTHSPNMQTPNSHRPFSITMRRIHKRVAHMANALHVPELPTSRNAEPKLATDRPATAHRSPSPLAKPSAARPEFRFPKFAVHQFALPQVCSPNLQIPRFHFPLFDSPGCGECPPQYDPFAPVRSSTAVHRVISTMQQIGQPSVLP